MFSPSYVKSDTEMSKQLSLSESTARNHVASPYRKIGVIGLARHDEVRGKARRSRTTRSSVVWATHANPAISTTSLHKRKEMVAATPQLPASGYALEVDGRLKAEFATKDGARAGGQELKKRFPMLQIRIYDAQTNAREEI
jgi:hypothetical protein